MQALYLNNMSRRKSAIKIILGVFFAFLTSILLFEVLSSQKKTLSKSSPLFYQLYPNYGVSEIVFSQKGHDPFDSYTVVIKKDGKFEFEGIFTKRLWNGKSIRKMGHHTGIVSIYHFNRLAQFIKDSNFMELDYKPQIRPMHARIITTSVVLSGKRKAVFSYDSLGPSNLWIIEQLIAKNANRSNFKRST